MSQNQTQTQVPVPNPVQLTISNQPPRYQDCLLVTRHRLLEQQEKDLNQICKRIVRIETLPNDLNELKKLVDFYDAVVGVIPLPFQVQILQMGKNIVLFYMESLGTAQSKTEAEQLLKKSKLEGVILPPAREGEPFRISVYKGLLRVKNIVVEDEFIIQH